MRSLPNALCVFIVASIAMGALPAAAAPRPTIDPDPTITKIDALFAAWAKPDAPGAALAVFKDGRILYEKGYGMADLERNVPITPTTVFDIGSSSKQFTAMSVLLLAREGKLSLDDEVQKYIPELPRYPERITIRHLLHHTSGIRDYLALMSLAGLSEVNEYSERQVIRLLARQKELNFKPGDEHLYSNSGYFLLSVVVKRAAGQSLRAFAERHIFRPLGMTHTHFHDDFTEIVKGRALAYAPRERGGYGLSISLFDVVGDGCLFTTVGDLAKWDNNFYANKLGGGQQLIKEMETPGKLNDGSSLSYALGLYRGDYRGAPTVSHSGAWAGYRAELLRFPTHRFSVVVLANRADSDPSMLARRVADIYLADRLASTKAKPTSPPSSTKASKKAIVVAADVLKMYVGNYELAPGFVLTISAEADRLFGQATGQRRLELLAEAEDRFSPKEFEASITFVKAPGAKRVDLLVLHQGGRDMPAKRVVPFSPSLKALQELCGTYLSEELGVAYAVSLKDGAPVLTNQASMEELSLRPSARDELSGAGLVLVFQRNGRKRVSGFRLDAGRVKHLSFAWQR